MSGIREGFAVFLAAAALSGCVTPPPAVLAYAGKACIADPDLTTAISLTPEKEKPVFVVTTPLDATAPCLDRPGGASPYRLYALPQDIETKTIMVGSVLEAARLVPPEISLLDRQGRVTRTFSGADYFFRGTVYSVEFRPRAAEAYVLVATNRARVGAQYDSIAIGTSTTSTSSGGATVSWTSGVDTRVLRTFSYEGAVQVTVYDSRTNKPR